MVHRGRLALLCGSASASSIDLHFVFSGVLFTATFLPASDTLEPGEGVWREVVVTCKLEELGETFLPDLQSSSSTSEIVKTECACFASFCMETEAVLGTHDFNKT